MKIAIVKLSAMGDLIHLGVFLPLLKELLPELSITWVVDEAFAPLLENSPWIDTLYPLPLKRAWKSRDVRSLLEMARALGRLERFDRVIDAQGLLKSALIASLIPAKERWGFDRASAKEGLGALFYHHGVNISYKEHILKRNAKLLGESLGISISKPLRLKEAFGYSKEALERVCGLLKVSPKKKILLVLEASKSNKIYPKERFLELARLCSEKVYLLWHNDPLSAEFIACNHPDAILLPKLNLDEVKALVSLVDGVVGGDTGVTHLAWAMERASVTLFGNTPLERFALEGERNRALRAEGASDYDKGDFSIAKISPLEVRERIEEVL